MRALLAAGALVISQGAFPTLRIRADGITEPRRESSTAAAPAALSARAALSHAYNHLLGVASPFAEEESGAFVAALRGLPRTDAFLRPSAALLLSVDLGAAAKDSVLLSNRLSGATESFELIHGRDSDALWAAATSGLSRSGLAASSVDLLSSELPPSSTTSGGGAAFRWAEGHGFELAESGGGVDGEDDVSLTGRLACSRAGSRALETLGLTVSSIAASGCPVFVPSAHADESHADDLVLDASDDAICQSLSEAALLVILSPRAAVSASDGPFVLRMALGGLARIAPGTPAHAEIEAVLSRAISTADAEFMRLTNGRSVTVLLLAGSGNDVVVSADATTLLSRRSLQDIIPPTYTVYSIAKIGDYHVVLWTAVVLIFITIGIIFVMLGMDSEKDPQLYTQIQDPRHAAPGAGGGR